MRISYTESRSQFRAAAIRLGWELEQIPIPVPTNCPAIAEPFRLKPLTVDVAISQAPSGSPTLVVSSGLHGVEAPFGAAVQLKCMRMWQQKPPADTCRIVFIHSMNPYGHHFSRRFDLANRDLNRNFLLPDVPYTGAHPLYARLDPLLNPKELLRGNDWFQVKALWFLLRFGLAKLQSAIAEGQYDYPRGLFFGGNERSELYNALDAHLEEWIGDARSVMHLDLHTGLGKRDQHALLIDGSLSNPQSTFLSQWLPDTNVCLTRSENAAYEARGGIGRWCSYRCGKKDYLYACAEFGTYPPLRVLTALRAENQAFHYNAENDSNYTAAKTTLEDIFYPADEAWRERAHKNATELVTQSLMGLQSIV